MSFFEKLFGRRGARPGAMTSADASSAKQSSDERADYDFVNQVKGDDSPPIPVDVHTITHAFIVLTLEDAKLLDEASKWIAELNRLFQPRVWGISFKAKCSTMAGTKDDNGYPNAVGVLEALRQEGLGSSSSIVLNMGTVSFVSLSLQNFGSAATAPAVSARSRWV